MLVANHAQSLNRDWAPLVAGSSASESKGYSALQTAWCKALAWPPEASARMQPSCPCRKISPKETNRSAGWSLIGRGKHCDLNTTSSVPSSSNFGAAGGSVRGRKLNLETA